MLTSVLLIVSGAPWTAAKARPPEIFDTETVDMRFSAEEKVPASHSTCKFEGGGSLRLRRCNFAACPGSRPSRELQEQFSLLHRRQMYHNLGVLIRVRKLDRELCLSRADLGENVVRRDRFYERVTVEKLV